MESQEPAKKGEKRLSAQVLHEHDDDQKSSASEAQTDSASSFSSDGCRKVSHEHIELVQKLIERCLQLYMSRDEVVAMLVHRAKVEPGFTNLVWQKLEEENADFFSAYYVRLKLKQQIIIFNQLLEKHCHLTNYREQHNAMPPSTQTGFANMPVKSSMGYPAQRLPHVPSPCSAQMEPLHYESSCHVVNGVPAMSNLYAIQQNIDTADIIKQEMAVSFASTESNGRFSCAPDEILRMNVQPMTSNAPLPPNTCTEGLQLAADGGIGNSLDNLTSHCNLTTDLANSEDFGPVGSYQSYPFPLDDIADVLLDSPDECDIVNDFIADVPSGSPQP